ncbi:oxygenase, partial [Streptomyces sp. NPDC029704]
MTVHAPAAAAEATLIEIALPDDVRDGLGAALAAEGEPTADIDRAMTRYLQVFAQLPTDTLQRILDFGRHCDTPG